MGTISKSIKPPSKPYQSLSPKKAVDALSAWFEKVARALPWRESTDPYRIWISEVMLQQTQVTTAIPYYHRFLERFPTLNALACAPEEAVLAQWSGLGYYSRARNLRRGAQWVVLNHAGRFPRDRHTLQQMPGVGPYTAGAILSIAFDLAEPAVDGNVQRVFSRYFALEHPLESKLARDFFWAAAKDWVEAAASPRAFNQALMELGATVCTKYQPRCELCPIRARCQARIDGSVTRYPLRGARKKTQHLWWAVLLRRTGSKLALTQNPKNEWWEGLWDFPRLQADDAPSAQAAAKRAAGRNHPKPLSLVEHTVTHHRIHALGFVLDCKAPGLDRGPVRWVTPDEARQLPLSALAKKLLVAYETGEMA